MAKCTSFAEYNFLKRIKIFFFIFYANILPHAASRSDTRENSTPLAIMPTRDLLGIFFFISSRNG